MATYGLPAWPWSGALVDDLPAPERLLADAFRLWSHEVARGAPSLPALRVLLAAEGAEAAAGPIEALLRTLARTGHPPVLACRLCPRLHPDEAGLLLACALAQRGARCEALATLLRWLPPLTVYAAMPTAIHLGAAFRRAGLLLRHPLREALPRR
ncbi:MAG: hypothetical protein IRZ13_05315 [Acetobacteraceae bacterium]|nr:hypothetical protein [Acetobacteraceae bacterium]